MVNTARGLVLDETALTRETIVERRRSVHQVGGVSDAEIGRNSPAHSAIDFDGLVLLGRQPKFYPR